MEWRRRRLLGLAAWTTLGGLARRSGHRAARLLGSALRARIERASWTTDQRLGRRSLRGVAQLPGRARGTGQPDRASAQRLRLDQRLLAGPRPAQLFEAVVAAAVARGLDQRLLARGRAGSVDQPAPPFGGAAARGQAPVVDQPALPFG